MKNCGSTVQNALRASPAVKQAVVSFEEGLARVWLREGKEGGAIQVRRREGGREGGKGGHAAYKFLLIWPSSSTHTINNSL